MRHVVATDGATFKTETEAFMTSDIPDFHPTDVLEDADGSILFVNTGGWFIAGCPLSVVAKADVRGGIYRIRKSSRKIEDPWGKKHDFRKMSSDDLVAMVADDRHAVRDNVFEQLITRGPSSIPHIIPLLNSRDEEIRVAAVFALYRIGSPPAMDAVVTALDDESTIVRTAACRVAGLAREKKAVDKLLHILKNDLPQARRQAATALGQIGDERTISPLLDATEDNRDRFVDHALIYSLISFEKAGPLADALTQPSEDVRRAALIALDQTDSNALRRDHLKPFLKSKSVRLRTTAVWALSHHPDWGDLVVDFVGDYFKGATPDASDNELVANLMVTFSHYEPLQKLISAKLISEGTSVDLKLMLLDVMSLSKVEEFPGAWVNTIETIFRQKNQVILSKALDVIGSRRISSVGDDLLQVLRDPEYPPSLKLRALGAKIASEPQLSDSEFGMLLEFLQSRYESTIRHSATRILGQADLTDGQLLTLARDHIKNSDAYLLSGLISAFEGAKDDKPALALVNALTSSSTDRLDNLSLPDLTRLFETFSPEVRKSAAPLLKQMQDRQAERLSDLQELEADLKQGDVGEGRVLFYGKALCSTCHAIAGNGGNFGPDLTNIGEIRSQHDILEAIVYPSASFAREYETSKIVTATATYTGIVKEQSPETVVVETGPGVVIRIPVSDVVRIETQHLSLMPGGLHKQLSSPELTNLMAYLRTLPDGLGHLKHAANVH